MDKIKKILINNQWSGVVSLALGTIISQSINLVIQPIITRLVSPEELGEYSFLLSMANLIIPVASLKLYMLIVVAEDDDTADEITTVSLITVVISSLLYSVFIGVMLLLKNNSFSNIGWISFIIPIIVLTNGLRFVFISYNNRYKEYSLISKTEISREVIKGILQIISGLIGYGAVGQAVGYAISPLASSKILIKKYSNRVKQTKRFNLKILLKYYKRYFKHILYLVPAQFINSFSYALITMSIISLYTATEVGYYSISLRVLGLPLVLVSNNVSRVFLQKLSEVYKSGHSVWKTYKSIIKILTLLSVIVFSLLAIVAPRLSELVFGEGYEIAGEYISILCAMFALRFITSSIVSGYVVFNKQKMDMIFQSLLVIAGVVVFFVTKAMNLNIYNYLSLITISYGSVYLLIIVNMGYICRNYSK